jgi:predicted dehydrogenase
VSPFVEGRHSADDANILVRFRGGAKGVLFCSQVSLGEENRLSLRVYGTGGSVEWHQEEPNVLLVRRADGPMEAYKPGHPFLAPAARHATRLPSGHPEAFLEAFANVYANAMRTIGARLAGEQPDPLDLDFPTVDDGVAGVRFIQGALASGRRADWLALGSHQ